MKREGGERGSPGARRSHGAVVSLAFAPHLGMVVSGSDDGCIRTWPLASEVRNQTLARGSRVRVSRLYAAGRLFGAEHRGRVSGLAVLGAKLASVGADRSLRLWNLEADLLPKADLMNDLNPRTDGSTVEDLARTDGSTVEDLTGSLCTTGAPVANIGAPVANIGAGRKEAAADAPSPADAPSQPGDAPSLMGETPSARSISTHVIVDAHAGELRGTAYATEISRLATAGADGTIKLWAVDEADVRPYSAHSRVGTRDGDDTLGDDTLDGDTLDGDTLDGIGRLGEGIDARGPCGSGWVPNGKLGKPCSAVLRGHTAAVTHVGWVGANALWVSASDDRTVAPPPPNNPPQ